jgi:hypothetical protein
MLVLLTLVVSVAAADSLNPSTLGPALYFAVGGHAKRDVALFTAGVFTVSTLGGVVLVLGPGRALLAAVSKPRPHIVHLAELAGGALLVVAAAALWFGRDHLRQRLTRPRAVSGRSAFVLGAGIMAAELPTAFPYFGALIAIVESNRGIATEIALVLVFNVVFIAPLLLVLVLLLLSKERGTRVAARMGGLLDRYAPVVLPALLAVIGLTLLMLGGIGLVRD